MFILTWMFPVVGSYEAARSVMAVLGRAGAIRATFLDEFQLDRKTAAVVSENESCWAMPTSDVSEEEPGPVLVTLRTAAPGTVEQAAMRREISTLVRAQTHPNIMHFQGFFSLGCFDQWGIVEDEGPRQTLLDVIMNSIEPLLETTMRDVVSGILSALQHLHALDIIHRDVKPESIRYSSCGTPLLSDFRIASKVTDIDGTVDPEKEDRS